MRAITAGAKGVAEDHSGGCAMKPLGARFQDVFGCNETAPAPDRMVALMTALEDALEKGELCPKAEDVRRAAASR